MTDDRTLERAARSFIESGPTRAPERVVETALLRIETTSQERNLRVPWRITMSTPARVAAAAVIGALAIGGALFFFGTPGDSNVGGPLAPASPSSSSTPTVPASPSPSQAATVTTLPEGSLPAGTYTYEPFSSGPAIDQSTCMQPPPSGCVDPGPPTSMSVTLTVPDGWDSFGLGVWIDENAPPGGAALGLNRGAWLFSDPCRKDEGNPDIPVGPTVDDFVNALANHPMLDTTTPVDATVDGYTGKELDLQVPEDILLCTVYRPWEPGIYAQGPGHLWHLRVIDVEGHRVVIQSTEYAGTDSQRRAELEAMVESIQIEP
jgi:hypothetical protein